MKNVTDSIMVDGGVSNGAAEVRSAAGEANAAASSSSSHRHREWTNGSSALQHSITSTSSLSSSPSPSPPPHADDEGSSSVVSLSNSRFSAASFQTSQSDNTPSAAMASLSVFTPPTRFTPNPLYARSTDSPVSLATSAAHDHTMEASARSCAREDSPPPAPFTQPPATSLIITETSGDGWSMIPRDHPSYKGHGPAESTNRRCVPMSSGPDSSILNDVPFGERASPAIISFSRPSSKSHSRGVGRATSPVAALTPARTIDGASSISHLGGLRGVDESLDTTLLDDKKTATENGPLSSMTPLVPPPTRTLCVRHQRMADEGTTARLQKSIECLPLSDQTAVNTVWSLFSSSSHSRRALILQGILTMCCFSQLSFLSTELALAIRIDPFSLFPREVSLKVLGRLDAMSLGRAAQVSRSWRQLADDDLLWRNMCEQHIERKCEKCGWGLPLLSERRRRIPGPGTQPGTLESRQLTIQPLVTTQADSTPGNLKRTITAAANAAALEKHTRSCASSPLSSTKVINRSTSTDSRNLRDPNASTCSESEGDGPPSKRQRSDVNGDANACKSGLQQASAKEATPKMRPWKVVYCERLAIERNWRRGRYISRTLTGHTNGIMCLQFSDNLAHPAFPVIITGSYDRTARIWNLETGEQLRVLEGHTRGVRCLQFDEAKLITGSMDRTLKIWNWRTGALMRTLEGHTEGIVCLHFNEDTLASGSADSNIKIWNFRTGECYTLRGHKDWVNAVTLWTGPAAKKHLQQKQEAARDGRSNGSLRDDDPEAAGTFLFSASDDGTIRLWDLGLRECLLVYDGHVGQVQSLKLVMMDDEAIRKLMGGAAGGPGAEFLHREQRAPRAGTHVRGNDQDMMSVEDQESYFINDQASVSSIRQRPQQGSTAAAATASAANRSSTASVASPTGASCSTNSTPNVPGGRAANMGPPGIPERFYSGPRIPDSDSNRRKRTKIDPTLLKVQERLCAAGLVDPLPLDAEMDDLDLNPAEEDNHSGDEERNSRSTNGSQANESSKPKKNGHRPVLISGSLDNTLKVWDVRTGKCIRTLFGHVEGVWSLDVDKLRMVSASHDRTIKIWDRDTGYCQNTLVGHKGAVTCLSLGDDKIVSGSDDGDLKVWSFAAAQPQAQIQSQRHAPVDGAGN